MGQNILRKIAKGLFPAKVRSFIRRKQFDFLIFQTQIKQKRALVKVRKKEKIKVVFFVFHTSVWKLDKVFQMMLVNKRYDPIIVVCPYNVYGEERMLKDMAQTYNHFSSQGYNTICTYDEQSGKWLDVKKEIQPDIVFFTNPHQLTKEEYYINNFIDTLTCYVPYGFMVSYLYREQYNQKFHNLLWIAFYETIIHKDFARTYAANKGKNVIVTGFPGIDSFLDKNYFPKDGWKIKNRNIKRIIWAPHHTIEDDYWLNYSNFLSYFDFFQELAITRKNTLQIAFKPHPILKNKLYDHPDWGKEKTDQYYKFWESRENTQLEEGDYIDLFLTSDALIHDSASFLTEYIFTGKPELFMVANASVKEQLNTFGQLTLNNVYQSKNRNEVVFFIDDVVFQDRDIMKEQRNKFYQKYLSPSDGEFVSQKIVNVINQQINKPE